MVAILVTKHLNTPEDLFGTAQNSSPRSDKMIWLLSSGQSGFEPRINSGRLCSLALFPNSI
jgi:hypothetical protein